MNTQEMELLKQILFDKNMTRNRQFETFQDPKIKKIRRMARILQTLHKELSQTGVKHWIEPTDENRLKLHLYHPSIKAQRTVFLTQQQWELLHSPSFNSPRKTD